MIQVSLIIGGIRVAYALANVESPPRSAGCETDDMSLHATDVLNITYSKHLDRFEVEPPELHTELYPLT